MDEYPPRPTFGQRGCCCAWLAAAAAGFFGALILDQGWTYCSAGGAGFNEFAAALLGAVLAAILGIIGSLVVWLSRRISPRLSVGLGLLASLIVAYVLLTISLGSAPRGAFFANDGVGTCPNGIPPWWPRLLP